MRVGRRHWLALLLAGMLPALALAGTASAAAPQRALVQARGAMLAIAKHTHGHLLKTSANDAATRLGIAAFSQLWSSPSEVVAPSFGTLVFAETAKALSDIERLGRASVRGLAGPIVQTVDADRRVVAGAIAAARGGNTALLKAAKRQLAAGDRAFAGGHTVSAVTHYTAAWKGAFKALTQRVTKAVTSIPSSAIDAAATNALGSKQIALAGPEILSNQPPLTLNGKPEVLYIGSEGCPFCGVQRWGMIVALSQFGTFSNLHLMQSQTTERADGQDVHVLRLELQQPVHLVRAGRGVQQRPDAATDSRRCRRSRRPSASCSTPSTNRRPPVHRRRERASRASDSTVLPELDRGDDLDPDRQLAVASRQRRRAGDRRRGRGADGRAVQRDQRPGRSRSARRRWSTQYEAALPSWTARVAAARRRRPSARRRAGSPARRSELAATPEAQPIL